MNWHILSPNEHGDWISHRTDIFDKFIPLGNKEDKISNAFFVPFYTRGLASARDSWCYNSSNAVLESSIIKTVDFYNQERLKFVLAKQSDPDVKVDDFVTYDSLSISWNRGFKQDIERNKLIAFNHENIRAALYRPFFKQHLYFAREVNDMIYQLPKIFPNKILPNAVICISGLGGTKENTTIISNLLPDLNCLDSGTQCFPLYYYEERQIQSPGLFDTGGESDYIKRDGVSDFIWERAKSMYGKSVSKEDIFYYVYGFLHSSYYRTAFANDLKKMLPRLPLLDDVRTFWKFSKAGRELAELHINYETVPAYEDVIVTGIESDFFNVEKMRFPKKDQKDTILFNSKITISNIPTKAYDYVVNGKSAIEWIMERYQITTHKESGIKNNPNDWATEEGNSRYILDLLLSIINVSIQTVDIVNALPQINFE
jgi:predicted helicase